MPPRIVFANEALERILGYSVDDILGMAPTRLKNVLHPDDREIFFRRYRDRLEGKKAPIHYELRIIRGDGSTGWLDMFASRLEYNGRAFVQATFIDITERKSAEERMLQSEEKYRTVIDNIQDGYYEVDIAGNFTFYNDTAAEIIGYSRKEIMGMNNRKLMDEENARKVYRIFNRVYRTRKSERAFSWEITRKDGTRIPVEVRFADTGLLRRSDRVPRHSQGRHRGKAGPAGASRERAQVSQRIRYRTACLRPLGPAVPHYGLEQACRGGVRLGQVSRAGDEFLRSPVPTAGTPAGGGDIRQSPQG